MEDILIASIPMEHGLILAAILFERTMERDLDGLGIPDYLWERKQIGPFLKIDRGLAEAARLHSDGIRPYVE